MTTNPKSTVARVDEAESILSSDSNGNAAYYWVRRDFARQLATELDEAKQLPHAMELQAMDRTIACQVEEIAQLKQQLEIAKKVEGVTAYLCLLKEHEQLQQQHEQLKLVAKEMGDALQRVWDEDECGWLTLANANTQHIESVDCGKCNGTHSSDISQIVHEEYCTQGFIHKALAAYHNLNSK